MKEVRHKGHILYDAVYIKVIRRSKSMELENRVVARGWWVTANGHRVCFVLLCFLEGWE